MPAISAPRQEATEDRSQTCGFVKLENKLNWSCELLKRTDQSFAEKISTTESVNFTRSASVERASANRKTAQAEVALGSRVTSISMKN